MTTFGSLFSGIGGIDLGLQRSGWNVCWQVESDPFCNRVLAKHWPNIPRFGDIHTLTGEELAPVDLIAGGFPCQPISQAGRKGQGRDDPRWLWPEFARIVRVVRPKLVFVENVPGLLGRGLGDVVGDLASSGYDAEWDCLPAAVFGAPHRRDRIWLVATRDRLRYGRILSLQSNPDQVSDSDRGRCRDERQPQPPGLEGAYRGELDGLRAERQFLDVAERDAHWLGEPRVERVAYGVPSPLDKARLSALGNAAVPQIAEWVGQRLALAAARGTA